MKFSRYKMIADYLPVSLEVREIFSRYKTLLLLLAAVGFAQICENNIMLRAVISCINPGNCKFFPQKTEWRRK